MIIGIVAIARNHAIGRNGKLPWHYSADLKFFKRTTMNSAVAMGFTTWKAIGKPLPGRLNIILSRSNQIEDQPGVVLVRSKDQLLALTRYLSRDLFIIGGAKMYESFADVIEKWIVTEIPETIDDANAFMPEQFLAGFELIESENLEGQLKVSYYEKGI